MRNDMDEAFYATYIAIENCRPFQLQTQQSFQLASFQLYYHQSVHRELLPPNQTN